VFGRIDVGGVLASGLTLRIVLWLIAISFSWVRSGLKESINPDQGTGGAHH